MVLTINEIPTHHHNLGAVSTATRTTNLDRIGAGNSKGNNVNNFPNYYTSFVGNDLSHKNIPRYRIIYHWRIA